MTVRSVRSVFLLVSFFFMSLWVTAQADATTLYAGTSNPGVVYEYTDGTTWNVISPEFGYAVLCLAEFEGQIYAGIRHAKYGSIGRVYRYDGDNSWTLVGDNLDQEVTNLAVYQENLYAATAWTSGRLYRYDAPGTWTLVVDHTDWTGFRAAYVWSDGYLYLGDIGWDNTTHPNDHIGRFDGTNFYPINPPLTSPNWGNGVWDFAALGDNLYLSAVWSRLSNSSDGLSWSPVLGYSTYMWDIEPFQGYLYMAHNIGCLRRVDEVGNSETVWWPAPEPIISLLADGDNLLYLGTGGEASYLYRYGDYAGQVYQYNGIGVPQAISGVLAEGVQCLKLLETDQCEYNWLGFLPPLTSNGNGLFKRGSTIPIKFRISDLTGGPASRCLATLEVFYWAEGAGDGLPQVVSYSNGDLGNTFRYAAENDMYIFNLSTKPWEYLGSMRYQIVVTLDDGQEYDIYFSLK